MKSFIPEIDLFKVQDSSKLQTYQNCPRRYFFEYVLGWRPDEPNIHLEFGTAVHLAMEILHEKGYNAEAAAEGFDVFLNHYRRHFGEELDDANSPKNPANFLRGIPQYIKKYSSIDEEDETLHIEAAGTVAIATNRLLYWKSDTIVRRGNGEVICREHKTGSRLSPLWAASWRRKMQASAYNHVLYCLFDDKDVGGVEINGLFFKNPPRTKKDGTPYASERDNEFHRIPVQKSLSMMEAWLAEVNALFDDVEDDFHTLSETSEGDSVLNAFHPNGEACTKYGICPFIDQCSSWANPLQRMHEVPSGFKVDHWDPRDQEYVRETIEVT